MIVKYGEPLSVPELTDIGKVAEEHIGGWQWTWLDNVRCVGSIGILHEVSLIGNMSNLVVGAKPWRTYLIERAAGENINLSIGAGFDAFLMNDDGKTIDRL